jgi:hypothetical protein
MISVEVSRRSLSHREGNTLSLDFGMRRAFEAVVRSIYWLPFANHSGPEVSNEVHGTMSLHILSCLFTPRTPAVRGLVLMFELQTRVGLQTVQIGSMGSPVFCGCALLLRNLCGAEQLNCKRADPDAPGTSAARLECKCP